MNAVTPIKAGEIIEAVIAKGDIAQLSPQERAKYYVRVCESIGVNPMSRPFEYITLNGRLTLYARKDCTDQLRQIHGVSVTDLTESERDGVYIVTAKVTNGDGRTDAAKGAVSITGLKGEVLANAMMKAETKAKRRATLSICGLGFLDETEIDDIPVNGKQAGPRDEAPPAPPTKKLVTPTPTQATSDDGLDIPAALDRRNGNQNGDVPPQDYASWLNDVSGAFSTCESLEQFTDAQRRVMAPAKKSVSAEAWAKAQAIAEETYRRVRDN